MIFTLSVLICCTLNTEPDTTTEWKEFPEYSCRLKLPDSNFKWSAKKLFPGLLAEIENGAGTSLVLAVQDASADAKIDKFTITRIQNTYRDDDPVTFSRGNIITFQTVPCYQYFLYFKDGHATTVARTFISNRYFYTLYLKVPQDQFEAGNNWDRLFDAFEFIGEPQKPNSPYRPPIPVKREPNIKPFAMILKYFFIIVGAILVIGLWYRNRNLKQNDFDDRY